MKLLHIFTGPPGAGKLVHVRRTPELRVLPIYCCYHYNKVHWDTAKTSAVLCAYSPRRQAKEHWLNEALEAGFDPILYVVKTDRDTARQRMLCRPKNNDLLKEIDFWFKNYTPHQEEIEIPGIKFDARAEQGTYTP